MPTVMYPVVLFPRYSTLASQAEYTTPALDVTPFSEGQFNVWRGAILGTGGVFGVTFEQSADQASWLPCPGGTPDFDPGEGVEGTEAVSLSQRYFRVRLMLSGTSPIVTCYVTGYMKRRERV